MAKKKSKQEFLNSVREEVVFLGFADEMLFAVEERLGLKKNYHILLFPGGIKEVISLLEADLDKDMSEQISRMAAKSDMRVREIIKESIKVRLKGNKEMLSQLSKYYFNLNNFTFAYKNFWRTVDQIWYVAGDQSTDFNHYTKRGLLFCVYKATFLHYVSSENDESTWGFLDKRIENALKIGKIKKFPKETIQKIKEKIPFIRLMNRK
jgi:ubiquinone biosynthesis protein COQ9